MIYCFEYKNIVRKYMLKFKFNNCAYISNFFANQILKEKKVYEILKKYDIIIPVPMGKNKYLDRGYNQTKLISDIISKKINSLENCDLRKIKNNKTQSKLNQNERKENVKNVFEIENIKFIRNKNIIILDDIYTTGATVNEISKVLKNAGAKDILVLIIAKD